MVRLKIRNRTWTGSVQGAVATWSVISYQVATLPVLTRSKFGSYFEAEPNWAASS